ncbi:hypothetical protein GCM10012284_57030 [Mangrovihabitans endophyticus]|uniref:Uncharacterized protein n=1 Tax=Mangrovihabitans endophyticus TaxID=1751298 RepID=A0A8J3C6P9_9ACTN|nr:hypothetical protein GCM10012284_57030 [Mangrovihabitans endophyticus]
MPLDKRLAAHRLLGGDVILDDGTQHLELAVIEAHATTPPSRCARGPKVRLRASRPQTPLRAGPDMHSLR